MKREFEMSGDLAERERARLITLEVLKYIQTLPNDQRMASGESWLHVRLIREMCDYKERLERHVREVLETAVKKINETEKSGSPSA
jgi:hypothetical protein